MCAAVAQNPHVGFGWLATLDRDQTMRSQCGEDRCNGIAALNVDDAATCRAPNWRRSRPDDLLTAENQPVSRHGTNLPGILAKQRKCSGRSDISVLSFNGAAETPPSGRHARQFTSVPGPCP